MNLCSAIFGVTCIDYERPAAGLLLGSGCGIMMAIMDDCPQFRYCVDTDVASRNLGGWVRAVTRNGLVDQVAMAGWFSLSDPKPLADALRDLCVPVRVYCGGGIGAGVFAPELVDDDLGEFFAAIHKKPLSERRLAAE